MQQENNNSVIIYNTEDGTTSIEVSLDGETVWLSQKQMAELFQKDVRTINEHIQNVYLEGELGKDSTIRNFRIVQKEGNRSISHLEMEKRVREQLAEVDIKKTILVPRNEVLEARANCIVILANLQNVSNGGKMLINKGKCEKMS